MSMKKFLVVCLSLLCLMFTFGLTACEDKNEMIELTDCEIGYELPVYPACEFDYKVNDECTIHVSSIKATLIEKNEIHEGDLLTEKFDPYVIRIDFNGYTNASHADKNIWLSISLQTYSTTIKTHIDQNGKMRGSTIAILKYTPIITFESLYISDF